MSKNTKMTEKEENKMNNLLTQVNSISKHVRQGSYQTRIRYYAAMIPFIRFLAKNYGVEKLANINNKHLVEYINYMKNNKLQASTIKTNLSAIRFYHDQIMKTRHKLASNNELLIPRRVIKGPSKKWEIEEYNKARELFKENKLIYSVLTLAKNEGLRIHEIFKINTYQINEAINERSQGGIYILKIKGKGGKLREVPLSKESIEILKYYLNVTPKGNKIFVRPDQKTHLVIKKVQNYIRTKRVDFIDSTRITDPKRVNKITIHGLRHNYANETYNRLIKKGTPEIVAKKIVSNLLGHERGDITDIYLD